MISIFSQPLCHAQGLAQWCAYFMHLIATQARRTVLFMLPCCVKPLNISHSYIAFTNENSSPLLHLCVLDNEVCITHTFTENACSRLSKRHGSDGFNIDCDMLHTIRKSLLHGAGNSARRRTWSLSSTSFMCATALQKMRKVSHLCSATALVFRIIISKCSM